MLQVSKIAKKKVKFTQMDFVIMIATTVNNGCNNGLVEFLNQQ